MSVEFRLDLDYPAGTRLAFIEDGKLSFYVVTETMVGDTSIHVIALSDDQKNYKALSPTADKLITARLLAKGLPARGKHGRLDELIGIFLESRRREYLSEINKVDGVFGKKCKKCGNKLQITQVLALGTTYVCRSCGRRKTLWCVMEILERNEQPEVVDLSDSRQSYLPEAELIRRFTEKVLSGDYED